MPKKEEAARRKRANTRHRWKAVERGIADALNKELSDVGNFTPIERIPLLVREGPDLTVNESGLVINVKSRMNIHPRLIAEPYQILSCGDLVIFRLSELPCFHTFLMDPTPVDASKMLMDWWSLMEKWTREFESQRGISAIILHRPRMPYGDAGIAIHFNDLQRLQCQIKTITQYS
jgi:hypothetical protein